MKTIGVKGMNCEHCAQSVKKALSEEPGVKDVQVDLQNGKASFDAPADIDPEKLKDAILKAGFEPGELE